MRKLAAALAVLLVLAGGAAYLALHYLDVIVKMALEYYGPDVAGVKVDVGEVRISPRDGRGVVRALELGNPKGFSAPRAARFGEIRVALDPATLTEPVVRIRELAIEAPRITYERSGRASNLDAIQENIRGYARKASAGEAAGGEPRSRKKRFIIERLSIRGGRVTMTNPALRGQGLGFDIPDIVLRDVGRRENGVTASEAAAIVADALQQRIAQKLLTNIDALRRGGVEGAVDALRGLLK